MKIYLTTISFYQFHSGCFSVCYCKNLIIGHNFGNILTMQTLKTQMLVTSLALQQITEGGTVTEQEDVTMTCNVKINFT